MTEYRCLVCHKLLINLLVDGLDVAIPDVCGPECNQVLENAEPPLDDAERLPF